MDILPDLIERVEKLERWRDEQTKTKVTTFPSALNTDSPTSSLSAALDEKVSLQGVENLGADSTVPKVTSTGKGGGEKTR